MPKTLPLPPLERLNELFEVVPIAESQFGKHSGLVRIVSHGGQRVGAIAGSLDCRKQDNRFDWRVRIDNKRYYVSRIIYYMVVGIDPDEFEIDHEDQNTLNNNVCNLRLGNSSLQSHNRGIKRNNTSGATGVSWHKGTGKWKAAIKHNQKETHLGLYVCKIEASLAYNNKVIEFGLDKIGKPLNDLEVTECGCSKCCT